MVNEHQEKFFCPRLIDYIVVVGSYSPLSKHSIPSSDTSHSENVSDNRKRDDTVPLNRSSSVSYSKSRLHRGSRGSKKASLYSVGRALTCSSFSASNSSVSHIQVNNANLYDPLLCHNSTSVDEKKKFFARRESIRTFCVSLDSFFVSGQFIYLNSLSVSRQLVCFYTVCLSVSWQFFCLYLDGL